MVYCLIPKLNSTKMSAKICFRDIRVLTFLMFAWCIERDHAANIYFSKSNNRNTRKRYEICSKLTINIPGRRH